MDFIVPLRSPRVAADWFQVSELCNGTLRSLTDQTTSNLRVHLVCHTPPSDFSPHPLVNVIRVDFPIPDDHHEMMVDKTDKVKRGLIAARDRGPGHVMVVDADDRVHRELASWVNTRPDANGWYVDTGYVHPLGSPILYRWPDFHRLCGTSLIVRWSEHDLPASMDEDTQMFEDIILAGHHQASDILTTRDHALAPLPFAGACYITDTADNHSGASWLEWKSTRAALKRLTRIRLCTSWHRNAFSL